MVWRPITRVPGGRRGGRRGFAERSRLIPRLLRVRAGAGPAEVQMTANRRYGTITWEGTHSSLSLLTLSVCGPN